VTAQLPYAGTEGFVGREASVERARRNAQDGTSADRQEQVLDYLLITSGSGGATWIEVGEALRLHHGQVSSTLSVLHQAGKVFQLREKRGRSHPYVHSDYRYIYVASERHDGATRTNAKVLKERNEEAVTYLEAALSGWQIKPIGDMARLVEAALVALNGTDEETALV